MRTISVPYKCYYLRAQSLVDFENSAFNGHSFHDFEITCSIYSKIFNEMNVSSPQKMGNSLL